MVKPDTDDDRRRKNEFAKRLVQFRAAKRWSQSDLWRRVVDRLPEDTKFHRTSISRYESGTNIPAPQIVQVLAETLGVSAEQLLPNEEVGRTDVTTFSEVGDGIVRVTIDKLVPYDVALEILRLARQ
jgi:transcriptional regulator with XRE-family HTH domain